jgi:hypothetical protein
MVQGASHVRCSVTPLLGTTRAPLAKSTIAVKLWTEIVVAPIAASAEATTVWASVVPKPITSRVPVDTAATSGFTVRLV